MSRSTYPPHINQGTPIKLSDLKPGQRYRYDGNPNEYRVLDIIDNYLKIERYDKWIVRVYFTNELFNQIVYVDNN